MPFTIHTHRSLLLNQNWYKVQSDKKGFLKFEERSTPAISQIKKKILTLSIFTFGFFYLYMKCSKNGRIDLTNIKNSRIVHYIQKNNSTNNLSKSTTQKTIKAFTQTAQPDPSRKGKIALDDLINFIDRSENDARIAYDLTWITEKAKTIIETCPFDSSSQSAKNFERVYELLSRFSQFGNLNDQLKNKYVQMGYELPIPSWQSRNPLDAEIVMVQREPTIISRDKVLPKDSLPVECVVLKGLNGKQFGIKVVSPDDTDAIVIVGQKNGQSKEVCVNKNEFAERLHLDPLMVSINGRGDLSKYITKENVIVVLSNYERILRKQSKFESSPLQPQDLIRIVKSAFNNTPFRAEGLLGHLIKPEFNSDEEFKSLLKQRTIIASFRGEKLFLCDIKNKQIIASGGEAEIMKVQPLSSKKVRIVKFFKELVDFAIPLAHKALSEANLVQSLHKDHPLGKVPGIQKPFYGVSDIETINSAIFMNEYDGNLREALGFVDTEEADSKTPAEKGVFNSFEEKLLAFYQPLLGFQYCVNQKGLIHQDIKLRNFLYIKNPKTKKVEIYLADFGSASLLDPKKQTQNDYERPWTSKYVLYQDKEAKIELGKTIYNWPNIKKWQEYVRLCRSWDIFSLGIVLADIFAPGEEWMEIPGHPKPGTFKQKVLVDAGVPVKLANLIESMVQTDWQKRPTIDQVAETYTTVLKEKGLI